MEQCFNRCVDRWFIQHPQEVGESYIGHAWEALKLGGTLIWWGSMEVAHAIVPGFDYFKLQDTTSHQSLQKLSDHIKERTHEHSE